MTPHLLDPLDMDELALAVATCRSDPRWHDSNLFVLVKLLEPAKRDYYGADVARPRRAQIVVWTQGERLVTEITVNLMERRIESWNPVPGAMAPTLAIQVERVLGLVSANEQYLAGLRQRGVHDIARVHLEVWPFGGLLPDRYAGRRVVYTPAWERRGPNDNPYAHPIHGYYAVVDLDTLELLEIEEHLPRPIPAENGAYRSAVVEPRREVTAFEPIAHGGPGFTVHGHEVAWQNWRMHVGFCPKEGLLIEDLRYVDDGRERRIAHRLSMAELVIPYADPSPGSYRKNAFDVGEVHMGINSNPLTLGCDCVGEVRYLDAAYVDNVGAVRVIENAICLHEEDSGILFKHTDTDGHVEVRRGNRFVVSSIYTVDNYEYGYYWYFGLDGSVEFEAKFTGIVLTLADDPERGASADRYGTQLAPGLIAPNHQHVFCARLDLDIDGGSNTVLEVDAVAPPVGERNPFGGAFIETTLPITRERDGRRHAAPSAARSWRVTNPGSLNGQGEPVAYRLTPRYAVAPLATRESSIGKRAGFMYADLWVTAQHDDEQYPAGTYPFQAAPDLGLPTWIADDENLEGADVVLWHVFGITHVPRLEDWPIMPVDRAGFMLTPHGFFDRNPALDVAPRTEHCQMDKGHA